MRILLYFLIPLLTAAIGWRFSLKFDKKKLTRIPWLTLPNLDTPRYCAVVFGELAAVQSLVYLLLDAFIMHATANAQKGLPYFVMLLTSGFWAYTLFLRLRQGKPILLQCFRSLAILCSVLIVLEIGVFNFKSIGSYESHVLTRDEFKLTCENGEYDEEDGGIKLRERGVFLIEDPPEFTRAVQIELRQPDRERLMHIVFSMKDDNFKDRFIVAADRFCAAHSGELSVMLLPYGKVRELQLEVPDVHPWVQVGTITLSSRIPFHFSYARYLILLVLAGLTIVIRITGFSKVVYDRKRRSHRIAVTLVTIVCTASSCLFLVPKEKMVEYPVPDDRIRTSTPYVQMFDALQNGRAWVDIPVDERLETLENPYDNEERTKSGIPAAWDRAYYNGKYYCYFGITPVLTIYYPFWFLFHKLPTLTMANFVCGMISALVMCLLVLALVRLYVPKPNFLLLLLLIPASVLTCGCFYMEQYPGMYTVPVASGITSLLMTLYLGTQALLTEKPKLRCCLLAGSGLEFSMCVGARPGMALGALALAAPFIAILLDKQFSVKYRAAQAGAFLIPALLGMSGLMYWNYIRFDSPLDFGAAYQFTVSDIHANKVDPSLLFAGIFQNFFQPLELTNQFPFFHTRGFCMSNYGMFSYAEPLMGAMWIPTLGIGTFLVPESLKMQGNALEKFRTRGFILSCVVLAVLLAWIDLCLGGTTQRYIFDFVPLLTVSSLIALLRNGQTGVGLRYRVCVGAVLLTYFLLLVLTWADSIVISHYNFPDVYDIAEDLLIFWN